jgi:TPR repeat protein
MKHVGAACRAVVVAAITVAMSMGPASGQKPAPSSPAGSTAKKATAPGEEEFQKAEEFGAKNNYAEALKWYRIAADKGHLESQNDVGMFYIMGMGVPKDVAEGTRWLRKAADQGHDVAQRNMGIMYLQGIGVPQDNAEAIRWLRKAAAQGDDEAKGALKMLGVK